MSSKREGGSRAPKQTPPIDPGAETLTDVIDRIGRESFRRSLDHRTVRLPEEIVSPPR